MREHHDPDFRLTSLREAPSLPANPHLGLRDVHQPQLRLGAYLNEPTTTPPAAVSRRHVGWQWPMLANDRIGDCVIAMMLHSVQDFALDTGRAAPSFQDSDAVSVYSAITGYNPSDPSTDRGTDENQAMKYWQSPGLLGHEIVASVAIDPTNLDELRVGIYEFVCVQLAIMLPQTAQGQTTWDVVGNPKTDPSSQAGSWGGHGVPIREYDATGFTVVTWGTELHMTSAFTQSYVVQAFVVVTREMLDNSGVSPSGVDWTALTTDVKTLGGPAVN